MQDKIDIKDDEGQLNDEVGKLGGDKRQDVPKSDVGKGKKDVDPKMHPSKP
jgi:hypothetical protein